MNSQEFNRQFTKKATPYADKAYIDKTLDQIKRLSKPARESLKEKIVFFLSCKNEKLTGIVFNELAGKVNDYQFFFEGEKEISNCEHCNRPVYTKDMYCKYCDS